MAFYPLKMTPQFEKVQRLHLGKAGVAHKRLPIRISGIRCSQPMARQVEEAYLFKHPPQP
jgi:hypothetical protein